MAKKKVAKKSKEKVDFENALHKDGALYKAIQFLKGNKVRQDEIANTVWKAAATSIRRYCKQHKINLSAPEGGIMASWWLSRVEWYPEGIKIK